MVVHCDDMCKWKRDYNCTKSEIRISNNGCMDFDPDLSGTEGYEDQYWRACCVFDMKNGPCVRKVKGYGKRIIINGHTCFCSTFINEKDLNTDKYDNVNVTEETTGMLVHIGQLKNPTKRILQKFEKSPLVDLMQEATPEQYAMLKGD